MGLQREVSDGHVVPVRNAAIHGGRRQRYWAPGSRIRRVAHDDDWFQVSSRSQELNDDISSGSHGMRLSLGAPSRNGSIHRSDPWLHPDNLVLTSALLQQPATIDPIDGLGWPSIGTPSMTTWSSELAPLVRSEQGSPKNQHGQTQRTWIDQLLQQAPNDRQINDVQCDSSSSSGTQPQPELQRDSVAYHRKSMQRLAPKGMPFALLVQQGAEHAEQTRTPTPEPVRVERSASNTPPSQHELVQAQSTGHS
jgi:hypothetical protein